VKLSHKLLVITAVPLAYILTLLFAIDQMHDRVVSAEYYAERSDLVIVQAQTLARQLARAESSITEYALTGDPKLAQPYESVAVDLPDEADRLKQLVSENPDEERTAGELARQANQILDSFAHVRTIQSTGGKNRPYVQAAVIASASFKDAFVRRLDQFIADERQASIIRETMLQSAWYQFDALLAGGAIAACLLTLALMALFSRAMARRLSLLSEEAERFAMSGEVGPPMGGHDEVAQVDEAFHAMAAVLRERQATLAIYTLLAQHAMDAMFFVRANDARILEVNAAGVKMYGYSRAELLSMRVSDLRDPSDLASLQSVLAEAEQGGVTYEARNRRKDGTIFPVEVSAQGAIVAGQRTIVGIVRDITERKQFERERERYFDLSIDPMCVAHLDGRLIRVNGAMASALGMTAEQLLTTPFIELVHPDDKDRIIDQLRQLEAGEHVVGSEVRARCSDGTYKDMVWDAVPAGEGGLIYAMGRDVTQQKAAQAALALAKDKATEASRLKSQFLANMSHEIRTPMNGVIGMTELLLSTILSQEQAEYASAIRESGVALLAIINGILDFSKLEAGKLELEVTEFSPMAIAEGVIDLLSSQARQKALSLQSFVAPDVPRSVRGDAGRVRQVLMNLIGNAIKFTEAGRVTLRVTREAMTSSGVSLKFAVSDTGIGIPASAKARLFEPFVQADSSFSRRAGGTGLGLSICKRLVELMQGDIGFESEEGKGTTFTFVVTFASASMGSADPPRTELRGRRLLVVDDDSIAREIIGAYVGLWGMRSDGVADGDQALNLLREAATAGDPYDVAVIDFRVPQMNGLALARSIRSDPALAATTLILATAFDAKLQRDEATRAGFAAYLTKPFKQAQLFMSIASAIRHGSWGAPDFNASATILEKLEPRPTAIRPGKVLVVEDNAINQKLATAQLRRLGLDADVAKSGQEAVDAIKTTQYALVFMDCQMPGIDGFEATRLVRASEASSGRHVPIIAITANALEGDREVCIAAGMDDYLSKPVQLEALRTLIVRWLPGFGKASASASTNVAS
jgi:two-component system, sensor histidine kinase and response regulator